MATYIYANYQWHICRLFIFVYLFRKNRRKERTKMKKYILGWKCFSFAYLYDNIIFILEFLYDMSRNVSEYVIFKRMLFICWLLLLELKWYCKQQQKCWNLRRIDALNSIQKTMLKFDPYWCTWNFKKIWNVQSYKCVNM